MDAVDITLRYLNQRPWNLGDFTLEAISELATWIFNEDGTQPPQVAHPPLVDTRGHLDVIRGMVAF